MTQAALAEICGLSDSYICKVENGIRVPTLKILNIIAKALGFIGLKEVVM